MYEAWGSPLKVTLRGALHRGRRRTVWIRLVRSSREMIQSRKRSTEQNNYCYSPVLVIHLNRWFICVQEKWTVMWKKVITQRYYETDEEEWKWKMWWKERPFSAVIFYGLEWQMMGNVIFRHVSVPFERSLVRNVFVSFRIDWLLLFITHQSSVRVGDWGAVKLLRPTAVWIPRESQVTWSRRHNRLPW
jgi:hypothetical protein